MHLEKQFDVKQTREAAIALVAQDDTLLGLFPETRTEIVERRGSRRTLRSHYRALGQEGTATFKFDFEPGGDVCFEKVCDGRVWKQLEGRVDVEEIDDRTCEVKVALSGRTKALVPEIAIKPQMEEQIRDMTAALRERLSG